MWTGRTNHPIKKFLCNVHMWHYIIRYRAIWTLVREPSDTQNLERQNLMAKLTLSTPLSFQVQSPKNLLCSIIYAEWCSWWWHRNNRVFRWQEIRQKSADIVTIVMTILVFRMSDVKQKPSEQRNYSFQNTVF